MFARQVYHRRRTESRWFITAELYYAVRHALGQRTSNIASENLVLPTADFLHVACEQVQAKLVVLVMFEIARFPGHMMINRC